MKKQGKVNILDDRVIGGVEKETIGIIASLGGMGVLELENGDGGSLFVRLANNPCMVEVAGDSGVFNEYSVSKTCETFSLVRNV